MPVESKEHKVFNGKMTVKRASIAFGISEGCLRTRMYREDVTLEEAIQMGRNPANKGDWGDLKK